MGVMGERLREVLDSIEECIAALEELAESASEEERKALRRAVSSLEDARDELEALARRGA